MESGEHTLRVGYNKVFGGILLVLAVACLVLGALVKTPTTMLVGAINTLLGILYMVRPYFVVGPHGIELKNMFGMTMRRYDFSDIGQLRASEDGRTIYQIGADGRSAALKLSRWLADGGDWRRFLERVQARAFE